MSGSSGILIIAIAAAGYLYSTYCYALKYRVSRESGHRLYLTSVTVGLLFVIPAWLLLRVTDAVCQNTNLPCLRISELEYTVFLSLWTIVFSYLTAYIYNRRDHAKTKNIIREWQKNDFDALYLRAQLEFKPIAISLDTGKVYVGMPVLSQEPNDQNSHITILPVYSGYRKEKNLKFVIATRYDMVAELVETGVERQEDIEDFYMTIPRDHIVSAHVFNHRLYRQVDSTYTPEKSNHLKDIMRRISDTSDTPSGTLS
ncbi:hypothetical protein SAMN05660479_01038 [Microbulbifer thermotolerans]|uniref:hypothetical protein n=1 Tax=Microbulbifer thermotolerans TaxID=252514 RepID=UPI0008F0ADB2|nr:hypothetical protein [Microbulbifer thermotolerans]SFC06879.1 hypothetical protein SAMN05660479_01038 [Microbulbifer thermotolerans]